MGDIRQFTPLWGVWEIDEQIGAGTYGRVYRAHRTEYGKTYYSAIKHISLPASPTEIDSLYAEGIVSDSRSLTAYYNSLLQRLLQEIDINVSLKGHTNIVSYEDHMVIPHTNEPGFDVFIRMELLTPLTQVMNERFISEGEVRKIGADICSALEFMGRKNILHRDIKPSNIFVSENGDFKLGDFGVSRSLETASAGVTMAGTLNYMAPELNHGDRVSLNSDMYSLGMVLYRLCNANRPPFTPLPPNAVTANMIEESNARRFSGELLPAPAYASPELAAIIARACEPDPRARWRSADEMRAALEGRIEPYPVYKPDPKPEPKSAKKSKKGAVIGICAAVLCVIIAGAIILLGGTSKSSAEHNKSYRGDIAAQPTDTAGASSSIASADEEEQTAPGSYDISLSDSHVVRVTDEVITTSSGFYIDFVLPFATGSGDGISAINSQIDKDYGETASILEKDYTRFDIPIYASEYFLRESESVCAVVIHVTGGYRGSEIYSSGNAYYYSTVTGECLTSAEYAEALGYSQSDVMAEFRSQATEYNKTNFVSEVNIDAYSFDDLEFYDDGGTLRFLVMSSDIPLYLKYDDGMDAEGWVTTDFGTKYYVPSGFEEQSYGKTNQHYYEYAYTNKANDMSITITEMDTAEFTTLQCTTLEQFYNNFPSAYPGYDITYSKLGGSYFVYSGYEGQNIFYYKQIRTDTIRIQITMKYPKSKSDVCNSVVDSFVTDFTTTATHSTSSAHHYEIYTEDITWEEAAEKCEQLGGHLVTITSQDEYSTVCSLAEAAGSKYCWLGGYTVINGGEIYGEWITGEDFSFSSWCEGEPSGWDSGSEASGEREDCIVMWYYENKWTMNDICSDPFYVSGYKGNISYICEYNDGY